MTTLPSGGGAGTVTIASPGSTTLQAVTAVGVPALPVPPSGAQFPAGVLGFKVAGVTGGSVDVDVHLPAGSNPSGYLKLLAGAWVDFSSHVTINGDVVTLHLVDNDAFDTDSAVGVIGDPGAPVVGYKFSGFRSPIDVLPAVNSAKGGQAIPVKWRVTDYAGNPISDPSSFVTVRSRGGLQPRRRPMRSRRTHRVRRGCSTRATVSGSSTGRPTRPGGVSVGRSAWSSPTGPSTRRTSSYTN